jgi:hypothetical protein
MQLEFLKKRWIYYKPVGPRNSKSSNKRNIIIKLLKASNKENVLDRGFGGYVTYRGGKDKDNTDFSSETM